MRNAELQGGSDPRGPPPCTTRARSIPHSAFRIPHSGFHVTIPNLVERAVDGRFGPYGGRYVPETLMAALEELERVYEAAKGDAEFWGELDGLLKHYVGRPTPLTETPRLGAQLGDGVIVALDRKSTRLNSSHGYISYAVFCLKKKKP